MLRIVFMVDVPQDSLTELQILPWRQLVQDMVEELAQAQARWPKMNSAHEGYAVIAEEFNKELWEHVCTRQDKRNLNAMYREAVQVAAMALRFASEVCNEVVGRR